MTYISSPTKKLFPYHDKICVTINNLIDAIHPEFKTALPILSGSYLINLAIAPSADFNDYDFYFSSKENFELATSLLERVAPPTFVTKNSRTYLIPELNKKVQLIETYLGPPDLIASQHDLSNSQIAYFNNQVFFTDDFVSSWQNNSVSLSSFQTANNMTQKQKTLKYAVVINRIKKYMHRYDLNLCTITMDRLLNVKAELQSYTAYTKANIFPELNAPAELPQVIHYGFLTLSNIKSFDELLTCIDVLTDKLDGNNEVEPF